MERVYIVVVTNTYVFIFRITTLTNDASRLSNYIKKNPTEYILGV